MIKYISSALAIICLTLLISCEKEVNINLDSGEAKLVIDGQIETNGYPFVILTKSIGYFSRIDLATLENSFVHNAIVKVSDGARTIQLKEYSIDTGFNGGNKFSFYAIDTGDLVSFSFKGVEDGYYSLSVETENKTFTAYTKIPKVKGVDSVWFRELNDAPVEGSVLMFVRYADPDTIGNYVRYFTKRNSDLFYPGAFNSTFDDQIVNGTIIDSLSLSAGYNKGKEPNQDSIGYFFKGDTVTLKWCAIDKGVYKFFSTLEYATGSIGNPFSSPVNVTSNIKGGALGVWAGYGIQETSRIISK